MKWNNWNRFLMAPEGEPGGGGGPPAEPPAGAPKSVLGTPGAPNAPPAGGAASWFDILPDDLKGHAYVSQSKDLAGFVRSAIDTKSMVGANTIKLPGDKATPEERIAFHKSLGRPDDIKGYETTVKPSAEHLVNAEVMDKMKTVFLDAGISKAQGDAILNAYIGVLNDGFASHNQTLDQRNTDGVNQLKADWGQNYEVNVKTAQLAVRSMGDDSLFKVIDEAGLGSDPTFLKFLHKVGLKMLDDSAVGDEGQGAFTGTTAAAAAEIERLKSDKDFMEAWGSARHPGHKAAVEKWENLHRQAYPGKQAEQS